MAEQFDYHLFGLAFRSEIELPELPVAVEAGEPDVEVVVGTAQLEGEERDGYRFEGGDSGFCIDGVGSFRISAGRKIIVQPDPGAPPRNVRLYLLGSAIGVVLHQRGMLPIHANSIEIDGRAYAFMGRSGAGKSTLAAAFHDHGYRVIADDVSVVRFGADDVPLVCPGIPRLRLNQDALQASGRIPDDFQLSYAGDDQFRKFDVPIGSSFEATPLAVIYCEVTGEPISLARLEARPIATMTLEAQEKHERIERVSRDD